VLVGPSTHRRSRDRRCLRIPATDNWTGGRPMTNHSAVRPSVGSGRIGPDRGMIRLGRVHRREQQPRGERGSVRSRHETRGHPSARTGCNPRRRSGNTALLDRKPVPGVEVQDRERQVGGHGEAVTTPAADTWPAPSLLAPRAGDLACFPSGVWDRKTWIDRRGRHFGGTRLQGWRSPPTHFSIAWTPMSTNQAPGLLKRRFQIFAYIPCPLGPGRDAFLPVRGGG
jgi:hypothetical protein